MLARSLVLALSAVLLLGGVARARPPAPTAPPPTRGALYSAGQTGRWLLGGAWLYRADPGDVGEAAGWWRQHAGAGGWTPVSVPAAYGVGDYSKPSMLGSIGWYRRDFSLPRNAFPAGTPGSAQRWIARFESVNFRATVWLNGHRVGEHVGANLPFEFALSGLTSGVNRLVVRVDNRILPGEFPPGPGGGWWNFGGLLREVYLRAVQSVDIAAVQVRPVLSCPTCAATVKATATLRNLTGAVQTVQLQGTFGSQPLGFGTIKLAPRATVETETTLTVKHPRLWAPGHPALYKLTLALSDPKGKPLGGYVDYTGIRSIKVTADGRMTLNGRVVHLRGVEFREQALGSGGVLSPAQIRRLIGWVRALGATVIRLDAPNPQIAELADREGLLLWLDIPVNAADTDFYLSIPAWVDQAHATLEDNILANGNHPSVMAWSVGNELPVPTSDAETAYIASSAALVRKLDPTRLVAMSISDWPGNSCQTGYGPLDAIGVNEYFGWYDVGGGTTDDRDALSPFLDHLRSCYPHQALFVTEFGFDATRSGPVEERGTYQFQANAAGYHLAVFGSKPWLSGAMYFLLQDAVGAFGYTGGNPWPDPPFNHHGLIDLAGHWKPAFGVVSAFYHHTVQIGPAL